MDYASYCPESSRGEESSDRYCEGWNSLLAEMSAVLDVFLRSCASICDL